MNTRQAVISIFKIFIGIAILMVVSMFVYKCAFKAYDFGYRIFAEEPMTPEPGYTMSVAIVEGKSVMEIGEILEEKGLIRSAYLFYLQELVSDYHGQLKPGIYELCTAMTPGEMMVIMSQETETDLLSDTEAENVMSSDAMDAMGSDAMGSDSIDSENMGSVDEGITEEGDF